MIGLFHCRSVEKVIGMKMKVYKIILIAFGVLIVLMVGLFLLLRFTKHENITRCSIDEGEGAPSFDRKEEMKKKELLSTEHITENPLSNEDGAILGDTSVSENLEKVAHISVLTNSPSEDTGNIVGSLVAQQLSSLSFSYALESVDSLKNASMRDRLRHNLEAAEKAKEELEELEKDIQGGKIQKKLVHGRWLVVVIDDNEMKCIFYHSPDGPIRTYTKNVYAESDRKNELHELGYELEFHLNGRIKSSVRRDLQEMLEYHPSGRLKNFAVETWAGGRYTGQQYMASWDMNGKLLHESISKSSPTGSENRSSATSSALPILP